jgi:peptidoglycan/LPS O-acetylase OafA/YrhL
VPVVFHHATPSPLPGLLGKGPLGVHLFFAISGFLITTLLLRERRATGAISLPAFYARRSLRIFPLYYLVLALYVAHAVLFRSPSALRDDFLRDVPYFATYTGNFLAHYDVPHPVVFGFSWSLATEEQFYLLFPPVLRVLGGRGLPALAVLALFGVDQAAEHGWVPGLSGSALRLVTSISAPICLGALAALWVDDERGHRIASSMCGSRLAAPLCLVALVASIAADAPLLVTHVLMTALVLCVCLREDHLLRAVLEHPVVARIGAVSYGIYLWHVSVLSGLRAVLPESLASIGSLFVVGLAASVGVALLSFRYIEEPFLRRKERFAARAIVVPAA